MLQIHYIDVASKQTLDEYKDFLNALLFSISPNIKQLFITNENNYHEKLRHIDYLDDNWLLREEKIKFLQSTINQFNLQQKSADPVTIEMTIKSPFIKIAYLMPKKALIVLTHIDNDLSPLSILYFMLHYADQNYDSDNNPPTQLQFNFYGSVSDVSQLHAFFVKYAELTRQLIPQRITLTLHDFHNVNIKKFPLVSCGDITGTGSSNKNYLATLAGLTEDIVGSPNDAMVQFLSLNRQYPISLESTKLVNLAYKQSLVTLSSISPSTKKPDIAPVSLPIYRQDQSKPVKFRRLSSQDPLSTIPIATISDLPDIQPVKTLSSITAGKSTEEESEIPKETKLPIIGEMQDIAFPVSIYDQSKLNKLGRAYNFTYLFNLSKNPNKYDLVIAPVAVLPSMARNLGVFANQIIPAHTRLDDYLGDIVLLENIVDQTYVFELNETEGIDALTSRNWTALVNGTSNSTMYNIISNRVKNAIYYTTTKDISPGDQLLIDYRSAYCFETPEIIRFLKTTDSSLESVDLILENKSLYFSPPQYLKPADADCLQVSSEVFFIIPSVDYYIAEKNNDQQRAYEMGSNKININAPLLALDEKNEPLPQRLQENITMLMYACATNNQTLITNLLKNDANPNIQSSIQGYTALHVVIRSSLTWADKRRIIESLIDFGAVLHICDKNKQSIVHTAIETDQLDLITCLFNAFINKNKKNTPKKCLEEIMATLNSQDLDPFVYSLSRKQSNIIAFLVDYISFKTITTYLKDDETTSFNKYFNGLNDECKTQLLDRFTSVIKKSKNTVLAKNDTLPLLDKLRPQLPINNSNLTFFQPVAKQPIVLEKTSPYPTFLDIISNQNSSPEEKLRLMAAFIASDLFAELKDSQQIIALKKIIDLYLDHVEWLIVPYHLKLVSTKESILHSDDEYIYLMPLSNSCNRFYYDCMDLNGKELTGEITLCSAEPHLAEVLAGISKPGCDISDEARLRKAILYLQSAVTYHDILTNKHAYIDRETQKMAEKLTEACDTIKSSPCIYSPK